MNGKKLIALALSLCLAGSITACGGSAGTEQKAASDGGSAKTQLNVATELTSATLDPADDWNSWFVMRWGALETLTRFEDDGTVSPWLAEDWSVADDQLTWTPVSIPSSCMISVSSTLTSRLPSCSIRV